MKSDGKFPRFHARLVCSFEGKVDRKSEISSIMHNHATTLGVLYPDKGACKVSNNSTSDISTTRCFDIIHVCRNNGHNKINDSPIFRHVEILVHICRNISTHLSKYRYVEITVRRNYGTVKYSISIRSGRDDVLAAQLSEVACIFTIRNTYST